MEKRERRFLQKRTGPIRNNCKSFQTTQRLALLHTPDHSVSLFHADGYNSQQILHLQEPDWNIFHADFSGW